MPEEEPHEERATIEELAKHQVAKLYAPLIGDIPDDPRYFDGPGKDHHEIEIVEGIPAETDIWEEVFISNSVTPTYILRYRKGDMVPAVWGLPPYGSWDFQPDLRDQPIE